MKKTLLLLLGLSSLGFLSAQDTVIDCSKKIYQIPYIVRNTTPNEDSLALDLKILTQCGNLDSVDQTIFLGSNFAMKMANLPSGSRDITYDDLLYNIETVKATSSYPKLRSKSSAAMTLMNTPVDIDQFDLQRGNFKTLDLPENVVSGFYRFLLENKSAQWTYMDAFDAYQNSLE